jgi:hypothetical protein
MDAFVPSIHDASEHITQQAAIKYIATFTGKTESYVLEILSDLASYRRDKL